MKKTVNLVNENSSFRVTSYGLPFELVYLFCFEHVLGAKHKDTISWLDLGCGSGVFISKVVSSIQNCNPDILIKGKIVDVTTQNVLTPEGFKFMKSDIFNFINKVNSSELEYDIVTLFDVVEHFEKDTAVNLIETCKRLGKICIVFTPRGFLRQDAETHPEYCDNPFLWHRCGFYIEGLQ